MIINLLLADPSCGQHHQPAFLDAADTQRCQQHPQLARHIDWQSSRFLKLQFRQRVCLDTPYTLSHSYGYSALAYTNTPTPLGIDVEYLKKRDMHTLSHYCFRKDEIHWWQQQNDPIFAFYHLWTLKEALLKAANLDFPADMQHVGWFEHPHLDWQPGIIQSGQVTYWHGLTFAPCTQLILSCVWPADFTPHSISWHGFGQTDFYVPDNLAGIACLRAPTH